MTNAEVARIFENIALILDLKGGENPFRVRAYERAAMTIGALSKDVRSIYETEGLKGLADLPGIGMDLARKIEELLKTGKLRSFEALRKKIPPGLLDIMEVEGMGPKKTKLVWRRFRVESVEDLRKLAASGKLEKLKGWGKKSAANILRGIELRKRMGGRLPLYVAWSLAQEMADALGKTKLCRNIEIAGSLRRRRETVGDIDILVTSAEPAKIMNVFCSLPQVASVTAKGATKSTVFLKAGIDADLRVLDPTVFGAALHYFTGSKDHNIRIRKIGAQKGLTISEYGVYRGTAKKKGKLVAARTEEDIFRAVGLPWIPPELREDRGEIETAEQGKLPRLLEVENLRGDLHLHSTFSDGNASMEEMAMAARDAGLEYIAITDHASPMGMVRGIKTGNIRDYLRRIDAVRRKVTGIHILAGTEVDILADGRLYLPDEVLRQLDWVVASVHQHFRQSREETTERLIRALGNPFVHALGHPSTRLLGEREGIDVDMDAVLREAKKRNVAIELNASPMRLDLDDVHCKRAKELGVKIVFGSDAHAPQGLDLQFGVSQARRGWLEKGDVLNTLPWKKFEAWLKKRRV